MVVTNDQMKLARARMKQTQRANGRVRSASYDKRADRVVVDLDSGLELAFPPALAQGLSGATVAELSAIEVSQSGLGLHWPKLDADLYVPALLQGVFGTKAWMARQLGASGGSARSKAKSAAARENGKRGGRPRKKEPA